MKPTVTVITLNEEDGLERCLKSVKEIAREIIIVDSGSTDSTTEIARRYGAKVVYRKFDNYANQKNFALQHVQTGWCLSLDGDEALSVELTEEIRSIPEETEFDGFSIPRKNIILGRLIRYTRWQPELDRHVWLWKKDMGEWVGEVHEEVIVHGPVGKLKNAKVHYQYETVGEFSEMMNRYSELEADRRLKRGESFDLKKLITQPPYNFLVRFFYRLGFLDGWRGFCLSYLMAIYHLEIWVKMWAKR